MRHARVPSPCPLQRSPVIDHQADVPALARLRSAFLSERIDRSTIKDAVCAYVDEMKRLGASVERIIIDIKRIAEHEEGPIRRSLLDDPHARSEARQIVEAAVTWCVEYYYWTQTTDPRSDRSRKS